MSLLFLQVDPGYFATDGVGIPRANLHGESLGFTDFDHNLAEVDDIRVDLGLGLYLIGWTVLCCTMVQRMIQLMRRFSSGTRIC